MRQSFKTSIRIKKYIILGDFIVLNVLLLLSVWACRETLDLTNGARLLNMAMTANFTMAIAQYFYSTIAHHRHSRAEEVLRQVTMLVSLQSALSFVVYATFFAHQNIAAPSISYQLLFYIVLFFTIFMSRHLQRLILKYYRSIGRNTRYIVFIGNNSQISELWNTLVIEDPSYGYKSNGYYADSPMKDCPDGLEYKGTTDELYKLMEATTHEGIANDIYCSMPVTEEENIRRIVKYCNNNFIRFFYVPTIPKALGLGLCQERIGDLIVFTNHLEPMMYPANKFVKRSFDILVSSCILLCILPFTPIIALIIKLQSPGPIFFKQQRTGLNGNTFYCYKFRSMHVNKDADRLQASEHDPRKFAFGNFMRKSNIDELPQFFNVLKGDMSIVGPRPHMLLHTEMYSKLIDKYMVRHYVKPGITGWAQVTGYRGETKELWQMEGRVKRDIWYINHWSIWLDIRIMWMTFAQVFYHDKNAY